MDEISVIDKKQVEELMVIHNNFNWFRFEVEGNSIHLSQPYHNPETQATSSYLTILQSNGEVDQYFDQCTSDGFEYTYLHLIFTGPHYNYYSAFPSRTGRSGFDLIKLNHDIGTFTFISSLTSANMDEEFTREMQVCKLYEDGKFIIGAYTKKLGDIQNSAVKYYCFDGHDLGLETTTSTNESIDHNEILLYPNPSNGIFNISFSNATSGQIEIFNILGQQIDDFVFNETTSFQIDNSDYIDGLYFAVITDTQRSMRDVIKIVISKSE